jgi:3-phenylpropionate/trans-cinnamate dioxygenase ferredoxin reductase subunit
VSINETFVIVGAGLAGAKAVEALREQGFAGRLVLIGAEAHRPYERPPLSKGYLAGSDEREKIFVHTENWYEEHNVEFRPGRTVTRLDRSAGQVELNDGDLIGYDKVLLCTGSGPRRLPIAGAAADGVHYLRSVDDSDALREVIAKSSRLVIIGAGWIGLEVTAAARQADVEVTVVETAELPLLRVLGSEVAQVFADLHREHGVDFRFNASIAQIDTSAGRATGVTLGDGSRIEADAVLVGVGAVPNTALAEAAGLSVDNGVLVDVGLRTEDPNVFAAGDIANAQHPLLRRRIRVEHWANALKQPATAATSMLGGAGSYAELPYFFTDQYDLGMEYVGYFEPGEYDQVVFRGDVPGREFIAFWLKDSRVLAGMNVNVWDVTDPIKALIRSGAVVDPARLADPTIDLSQVAT